MSNSSAICVDANILIQLIIGGAHATLITNLWTSWHEAEYPLIAPALLYYEISNVIHRYVLQGLLLPEQADKALATALSFDIALYTEANLHQRAVVLARQFSLPAAYDAHYLALAERVNAEFWTTDRRLARVVQTTLPWVHLVE
jgi:predicted nucleic acid-binding protein